MACSTGLAKLASHQGSALETGSSGSGLHSTWSSSDRVDKDLIWKHEISKSPDPATIERSRTGQAGLEQGNAWTAHALMHADTRRTCDEQNNGRRQ